MDFLPLPLLSIPQPLPPTRNSHTRHFQSFRHPLFIRQPHPLVSLTFSPTAPHRLAIASSSRVLVYSPRNGKVVKTITRFKDTARGLDIRRDGRLMSAGGEDGIVQVFDLGSRAILRTMKGQGQPVHQTRFSPHPTTHPTLLSASDSALLSLYDIPTSSSTSPPLRVFSGHGDYVRSCLYAEGNPEVVVSGGYDGLMKVWDGRVGEGGDREGRGCVMTMGHGAPVEDVLLFPTIGSSGSDSAYSGSGAGGLGANVALSCGGPILRVWDLTMGGRCIKAVSNHQKTVTCLAFEGGGPNGGPPKRLLTGGLDMMVKVYDVERWTVVHTMRYPAPVLTLKVSPGDTSIACGMTDGTLSLRRRDIPTSSTSSMDPTNQTLSSGAYEYFADFEAQASGANLPPRSRKEKEKEAKRTGSGVLRDVEEVKVEGVRRERLKAYDRMLKGFRYGDALDAVMVQGTKPLTAFSLLTELVYRDGLRRALSGRDDVTLQPVLRFLARNVTDTRFGGIVVEVMDVLLDIYGDVLGQSPLIDDLLSKMQSSVRQELRFQQQLVGLNGALEMVLAQSALAQSV